MLGCPSPAPQEPGPHCWSWAGTRPSSSRRTPRGGRRKPSSPRPCTTPGSRAPPARILALPGTERIIADIARRIGDTCAAAFGPVISAAAKERILTLIDRTAGQRHSGTAPDDGWYVPATIIIGADGPAVTEEVFGPVLTVEHVTASQAAKRANSTRHALSASIWTDSLTLADRLTRDLRAGEIWRNCHLTQTPGLPHTGTGGSGHGPHMSPAAIDHWTTPTTITTRTEAP